MRVLPVFLILVLTTIASAQETAVHTDAFQSYKKGLDFYNKGLFGLAQEQFRTAADYGRLIHEPEFEWIRDKSELYVAQCAVRLDAPDGQMLVERFAADHKPAPISQQALLEMGNYFYNQREYEEAIDMFASIDQRALTSAESNEVTFKLGYCQFVSRNFPAARTQFSRIKDFEDEFYYPSNYYYGLTAFFEGDYDEAIFHFHRVSSSQKYEDHIPYYITQIYFAKGEYDNVIDYALPKVDSRGLKNGTQMKLLIAQAYYEKGEFENALPFFMEFGNDSRQLRPEDYYQIGFVNYKTGNFEEAVRFLSELNREETKLGQHAMYFLADSYLQLQDRTSARNAFSAAAGLDFDPEIKEEARFNYAKLSYELGYSRDAIDAFLSFGRSSRHYEDAQALLSDLFLKSRDYARAITLLEGIDELTPKLRGIYQQVLFLRGIQLVQQSALEEARVFLKRSKTQPSDGRTLLLADYWLGDIAYREENYSESKKILGDFIEQSSRYRNLPEESSVITANYTLGYIGLKEKNYKTALLHFQETVSDIQRQKQQLTTATLTSEVFGDAVLRAGDCLFKQNSYNGALQYYNSAINNRYSGFIYALYQKALIEGLKGNTTEKIVALEEIFEKYPNSEYSDDALLQLGTIYQELNQLNQARRPLLRLVTDYKGKSGLINAGLLKLGLISYNQGDARKALEYYEEVLRSNPSPEEAQSALVAIEEIYIDDLNDPDGYFEFIASVPGYNMDTAEKEAISYEAAESQYENANYETAIVSYTRYLQKYPEGSYSLSAHFYRGECHAILKQYSEALIDYDYVAGRGVSQFSAKALRKAAIIAEQHEKDYERAFRYYSQLENQAISEEVRFEAQRGALQAAYQSGKSAESLVLARKVIANPLADTRMKGEAEFYIGKITLERKDYDASIQAFSQTIQLLDGEMAAEARYQIAYMYYLKRDMNLARELSNKASYENSGYPYWVARSIILLSDILAEQGDLFNAEAALSAIIESYSDDEDILREAQEKRARILELMNRSSRMDTTGDGGRFLDMQEDDQGGSDQ